MMNSHGNQRCITYLKAYKCFLPYRAVLETHAKAPLPFSVDSPDWPQIWVDTGPWQDDFIDNLECRDWYSYPHGRVVRAARPGTATWRPAGARLGRLLHYLVWTHCRESQTSHYRPLLTQARLGSPGQHARRLQFFACPHLDLADYHESDLAPNVSSDSPGTAVIVHTHTDALVLSCYYGHLSYPYGSIIQDTPLRLPPWTRGSCTAGAAAANDCCRYPESGHPTYLLMNNPLRARTHQKRKPRRYCAEEKLRCHQ
ncbi:hypothetical protein V8C26DRAFT_249229 [Trichoderma gracile]